jgi:membrane protease YdiL (CAAX protease family)
LKFPSIKQVNRIYLITLLLVLVFGSLMQIVSFSWGLLGTELLLILLPVIWFHRKNNVPLAKNTRLQKPRAAISLVAVMLGGGAWLIDSIIESFMIRLTGYSLPAPEGILPANWFEAIIIFAAFAIAAPICEEFLFRGTIQRGYHNEKKPLTAILIVSLMFVVFHLRFQGFLSLIPIALLLGYTYWRTQSLAAAMLVHFANNALAAVVIIQAGLFPELVLPFPSMPAAAFGILMVVAGLFLLTRLTTSPEPNSEHLSPSSRGWSAYWPLITALVVFSVMAVVEVVTGKLMGELKLNAAQMPQQTATYIYQIRHKGDQPVGEMFCTLQPLNQSITLACARTVEAFEYQSNNSFYSSLDMETSISVAWNQEGLALQQMSETNSSDQYASSWQIQQIEQELVFSLDENGILINESFPTQTLVEDEWPWRLMGLPFSDIYTAQFNYLEPLTWRQKTQDNGPSLDSGAYLTVNPAEEISTPAGTFTAWKISLSNNQTAWYDVNAPHTLVKVEARMFDYYLISTTN